MYKYIYIYIYIYIYSTICRHACFGVLRLVSAAWYTSRYAYFRICIHATCSPKRMWYSTGHQRIQTCAECHGARVLKQPRGCIRQLSSSFVWTLLDWRPQSSVYMSAVECYRPIGLPLFNIYIILHTFSINGLSFLGKLIVR